MRTEVPVIKRCCFCIPLRHGLIAWGYLKLSLASPLLIYFIATLYRIIYFFHGHYGVRTTELIIFIVLIIMVIFDIVLHIVFLIGAHKKDTKLLRVYYLYSLTVLGLTIVCDVICTGFLIKFMFDGFFLFLNILIILGAFGFMFANLFIHAYIVLLVRSEIIKLNSDGTFRFVNLTADAECDIQLEHEVRDKPNTDQNIVVAA